MTNLFATASFAPYAYEGADITADVDGFTLTATLFSDDNADAPWEREDGHGPVSEWTRRSKLPGELVLNSDRTSKRYYDFAEACRIARKDGWGVHGGQLEGETRRAYAARAAMADYERLRRWCADQWEYVGVSVKVERDGEEIISDYAHALWGIESDSLAYLDEVANELAVEALAAAKEF